MEAVEEVVRDGGRVCLFADVGTRGNRLWRREIKFTQKENKESENTICGSSLKE